MASPLVSASDPGTSRSATGNDQETPPTAWSNTALPADQNCWPISSSVPFTAVNGDGKKRVQVKNACTNCKKACKKCGDSRPCPRCVQRNIQDTCVDSERKSRQVGVNRGPYRRKTITEKLFEPQQPQYIFGNQSTSVQPLNMTIPSNMISATNSRGKGEKLHSSPVITTSTFLPEMNWQTGYIFSDGSYQMVQLQHTPNLNHNTLIPSQTQNLHSQHIYHNGLQYNSAPLTMLSKSTNRTENLNFQYPRAQSLMINGYNTNLTNTSYFQQNSLSVSHLFSEIQQQHTENLVDVGNAANGTTDQILSSTDQSLKQLSSQHHSKTESFLPLSPLSALAILSDLALDTTMDETKLKAIENAVGCDVSQLSPPREITSTNSNLTRPTNSLGVSQNQTQETTPITTPNRI